MDSNILLPESLLKEAVIRACERENAVCDKLIAEREEPAFSGEYKKNIQQIRKEAGKTKKGDIIEHPYKRISKKSLRFKIVLIAIIIMMFGSMTVMAVEPLRQKMYKIVETLFPDHTDVSFVEVEEEAGEDEADSQTKSFDPADFPKKLKWVPEGLELNVEEVDTTTFWLLQFYDNENSHEEWQQIEYQQVTMESSTVWSFTSDGAPAKEIDIGEEKGHLFTDEGGYHSIIVKKDGFAYYIGGNVEVEILTKCLESAFERE